MFTRIDSYLNADPDRRAADVGLEITLLRRVVCAVMVATPKEQVFALASAETPLLSLWEANMLINDFDIQAAEEYKTHMRKKGRSEKHIGEVFKRITLERENAFAERVHYLKSEFENGWMSDQDCTNEIYRFFRDDSEGDQAVEDMEYNDDLTQQFNNGKLVQFAREHGILLYNLRGNTIFHRFSA
jgi:hypothetical protein